MIGRSLQLAQRAYRFRECQFATQLPIARRPLFPQLSATISVRHRLDHCNILCPFCSAEHWIEERVQACTLVTPKFSACCGSGTIAMDTFNEPPQPLYSLLIDCTPCLISFHLCTNN